MRLVRYADDFVVMVHGTRDDAEALWDEVGSGARSDGPAPVGSRRRGSATSTRGSTSSGWRIQRRTWRGRTGKKAIYTYPSKKALALDHGQGPIADPPSDDIERSQTCCAG